MKKFIALLTAVMFIFSAMPAFAASDKAETVLKAVKSKINVPDEMTEFEYSENTWSGRLLYYFYWNNDDGSKTMHVSAYEDGVIASYDSYDASRYTDTKKGIIRVSAADAKKAAEEFVKNTFPEMFENEDDVLKLDDTVTSSYTSNSEKWFYFTFKRCYKGIEVYANNVTVTVYATEKETTVTSADANLDMSAVFDEDEHDNLSEKDYEKVFPATLYYRDHYNGEETEVKLVYSIKQGFVSEKDGKSVEYSGNANTYMGASESAADAGYAKGMARNDVNLTPKEQEELSKMGDLLTAEELENMLRQLEELGLDDDMDISYSNTYKSGDIYYTSMELSDKDGKRGMNARFNAKNGEILSIYNYSFTENDKLTDEEKSEARSKAKAFMEKLEADKMKEVEIEEKGTTVTAYRLVNGVQYPQNSISCSFNALVSSYRVYWDEDKHNFEDPKNAISAEEAYRCAFNETKLTHVWLNTGEKYIPAITIGKSLTLDALSGEDLYKTNSEQTGYSDIEGHWAEEMINTLLDQGIYLDGSEFRPNEAITQGDMLRLFGAVFYYPSFARGKVDYEWLIRYQGVISKDAAEDDKPVAREEAFKVFVNMMGAGEVAELDIFKASFEDADSFSGTIGSAEILKAMGVLTGTNARPTDNLKRAEAIAMVYRYLDR